MEDCLSGALGGEVADADDPLRFEDAGDLEQMFVAPRKERFALTRFELVRRAITAGFFEKSQRAIIHDEVVAKEFLGRAETFREQSPETFAADLAAVTIESGDGPLRVFERRTIDLGFDAEPIADSGNLAERDPGLRHAKGPGTHSEKQDPLRTFAVAF